MHTVAVDAMGGDHAPDVELDGIIAAVRGGGVKVLAVGDPARLEEGLARRSARGLPVDVVPASQVITMDDAPAQAVRRKTDASMRVCFELVKRGEAAALVSAGNSGAMLAGGTMLLGRLPGVDRPGIVTSFPTRKGWCALLDVGANVEPRPEVLAQLGVMGAVYASLILGKERPRVGVLSNGAEEHKGTELTRGVARLLRAAPDNDDFRYVGYVEGRDLFSGDVDVVVTDGFTGNVVLKASEGAADAIFTVLRAEVQARPLARLAAALLRPALRALKRRVDYAEQGGAPLLGVRGVAIVCHGGSSARALKNGIGAACRFVEAGLAPALTSTLERHQALWSAREEP